MPPTTTAVLLRFLLLSSCSLLPLSSTTTNYNRRILHQPFFPAGTPPPTQPPTPSPPAPPTPPKYPFSTSTPPDSPFFPSYPSPPSPPSPSSFASFPANISSLNLPHSPKSSSASSKLIATAVAAVVAAVIVVSVAVFLHVKKRRKNRAFSDTKTSRSDNSSRYNYPNNAAGNAPSNSRGVPKLSRPSQTSSEFLYLGTLVNSHNVGLESHASSQQNARSGVDSGALNTRKMDSPELRPLPPLIGRRNEASAEVGSVRDEESEEFYSPRGSVGGRESSIGAGSASRRAFAAVEVANLKRSSSSSSLYSSSSSGSGSPARSVSLSVSPPGSVSPKSSRPKSPELDAVQLQMAPPVAAAPPPPPPPPPRPVFTASMKDSLSPSPSCSSAERYSRSLESSPRISDGSDQNVESPVRISSPVKQNVLVFNPCSRFSSVTDQKIESPEMISSPVKQDEPDFNPYPRMSNASDHNVKSPERTTSPLKQNAPSLDTNSRVSDVSDQEVESPERNSCAVSRIAPVLDNDLQVSDVSDEDVESPGIIITPTERNAPVLDCDGRITDVSDEDVESPVIIIQKAPVVEHDLQISDEGDQIVESPVRISSPLRRDNPASGLSAHMPPPISVPPPPPPPPTKYWESPRTPTPPARKPVSEPPHLVTPLRPMVIQSPAMISPMQLPEHLKNGDKNEESVGRSGNSNEPNEKNEETPKPKLKPLHWDKVRASSDREMVWDQLRSSSFKLNEEMIESLFIANAPNPAPKETTRRQILPTPNQENRVLDPKKSQNIAILLKALHVTVDEVCEALLEGNADTLGTDLLESLLKMAPTKEEERKLIEHKDDSPIKLGPAEKFLKAVLDIPFAFKRVDALLYISNFDSEIEYLKRSFETLEAACEELRNSRMFLKLLEAVLKTGNRMNVGTNRGDAHAFKLDTLLKLVDVKGADGKTTLLHFVVQEIIRSEGARLSASSQNQTPPINDDIKCRKLGLQVVSGLSSDLSNVKKAAAMDSEMLNSDVLKLAKGLQKIAEVVRLNEAADSDETSSHKFSEAMNGFMKTADEEIIRIQAQESLALTLVKEITEYFHGNSAKEEAHPFRIFMVVRDFLSILDRVCKEVGMINERTIVSSAHKFPVPVNPMLQPVSSVFPGRRQYSSSDDDNLSP